MSPRNCTAKPILIVSGTNLKLMNFWTDFWRQNYLSFLRRYLVGLVFKLLTFMTKGFKITNKTYTCRIIYYTVQYIILLLLIKYIVVPKYIVHTLVGI